MNLSQSSSLIGFLLILSMLSPSEAAAHTGSEDSASPTIESRMKRIASALKEREDQLDLDPSVAPDLAPLIAQFRNAFRNGGGGYRGGGGFRNGGGGFANRAGGGGFANRVGGGGFVNRGPGWANAFRNSPGFYNYRY